MSHSSLDPHDLWPEVKALPDRLHSGWSSEEEARRSHLRFLKRLSTRCRHEAEAAGVRFEPLEKAERKGVVRDTAGRGSSDPARGVRRRSPG